MYKTIYPYMVAEIVSSGKTVFAIDKMERSVKTCNTMTVTDFFRMIHAADADKSHRYDFFTVDAPKSDESEDESDDL